MALDFWSKILKKNTSSVTPTSPLFFYNTLSLKKEKFDAIRYPEVKMYNCGPTVYDYAHIGNLSSYVFADTLKQVLEYNGYKVTQVINITDVGHMTGENNGDADTGEDKMEKSARLQKKSVKEITEEYTDAFFEDLLELNIDIDKIQFPRATENIVEQIALVETLEQKGYTYKTSDGIYFDTKKFSNYGKLGNINLKGLEEGARVTKNPEKKNATDFALWKFSPKFESNEGKREQEWDSPWGTGFPGWHLECSAMSMKFLGKTFDIHTGGIDHIPVHHNNEIAQSEVATGKPFAKYWLHNAHILVEGKKISKSIGNTIYLKNLIAKKISPLAYRYWLLTSNYRTQTNFTWDAIEGANTTLFKLQKFFVENLGKKNGKIEPTYQKKFQTFINDDLNTAGAIAVLWSLVKDEKVSKEDKRATLLSFDQVFGFNLKELDSELVAIDGVGEIAQSSLPPDIQKMIADREVAREEENWELADELRKKIADLGYTVEDKSTGVKIFQKN